MPEFPPSDEELNDTVLDELWNNTDTLPDDDFGDEDLSEETDDSELELE